MTLYIKTKSQTTEIYFQEFPNHEKRLDLTKYQLKEISKGQVIFKYTDDSSIFELLMLNYLLNTHKVNTELVVLYLPYSRMDRVEDTDTKLTCFTLDLMTDILANLDSFKRYIFFDLHSEVTVNLLRQKTDTPIEVLYCHSKLLKQAKFNSEKDILVFPDRGAYDRYYHLFETDAKHIIVGEKHRDFDTGYIKLLEVKQFSLGYLPITKDTRFFIIDDLCSYGGTFTLVKKALENLVAHYPIEEGTKATKATQQFILVVTHSEDTILKGEVPQEYNHIYTTNSILDDTKIEPSQVAKFTILDLLKERL